MYFKKKKKKKAPTINNKCSSKKKSKKKSLFSLEEIEYLTNSYKIRHNQIDVIAQYYKH